MKLELDIEQIDKWLKMTERSRSWLGRQLAMSPASMYYIWNVKPISQAEKIALIMGIEPKALIKQS